MVTNAERRQFLRQTALASGLCWSHLNGLPAYAADKRPVLVLGASGGTGRECVNYLLSQGRPCIAATRSGEFEVPSRSPLLTVTKGDVTDAASLGALIRPGLSAVIYAASASRQADAKKTSNAKAVDRDGVVACAKLCIASEVPRMVLVSSGGVSKPTSAVYLFLNVAAGGIMDAKISGENEMRRLYAAAGLAQRGVGYTVVRPGGLTREAPRGVSAVELNQGDTKSAPRAPRPPASLRAAPRPPPARPRRPRPSHSPCVPPCVPPPPARSGRIARADVAAICIESLSSAAAFDTTFECYDGDTGKDLDSVMQSNAKGVATGSREATDVMSGRERRADSWPKLFEGLERDQVRV